MRCNRVITAFWMLSVFAFCQAAPTPGRSAGAPVAPQSRENASARAPQANENPGSEEAAKAAALPPETPVITLEGICSTPAAKAAKVAAEPAEAACKTVVTKAQFERVVEAVVPEAQRDKLPPTAKQQIARQLAMLMVMSQKAEQKGLQRDPSVEERIKLGREQALAQAYNEKLADEAKPSDAEITADYSKNPAAYEEVTLERLYIPKSMPSKDKPVDANAEKAAAQKLRERAAAGEDFAELEKEAFAGQPNPEAAPSVEMGPRRRGSLPVDQESAVFALNAGQISQLLENPAGWYVYKAESKRTLPLSEVKEEISRRLQQQKYMDLRNQAMSAIEPKLNDAYFGATAGEATPSLRSPSSRVPEAHPVTQPPKASTTAPKSGSSPQR